mmetsp:Transcript_133702/g.250183  ORF Transcript_133702/g.250183 Transcript_133702/m.250183 type:complete len:81 (-) Transcript_133702:809-1051(-)
MEEDCEQKHSSIQAGRLQSSTMHSGLSTATSLHGLSRKSSRRVCQLPLPFPFLERVFERAIPPDPDQETGVFYYSKTIAQ